MDRAIVDIITSIIEGISHHQSMTSMRLNSHASIVMKWFSVWHLLIGIYLLYARKNKKDHITVMFQWLDSKGTVCNIYYAHSGWRRPAQKQKSAIIERNSFLVDIIQLPNRNRII